MPEFDGLRCQVRAACAWTCQRRLAILTSNTRALGHPRPLTLPIYGSPAHQLVGSPAHQLTSSPDHQLTSSPAHQLTTPSPQHLTPTRLRDEHPRDPRDAQAPARPFAVPATRNRPNLWPSPHPPLFGIHAAQQPTGRNTGRHTRRRAGQGQLLRRTEEQRSVQAI